jgi:hypothetical protein
MVADDFGASDPAACGAALSRAATIPKIDVNSPGPPAGAGALIGAGDIVGAAALTVGELAGAFPDPTRALKICVKDPAGCAAAVEGAAGAAIGAGVTTWLAIVL